MLICYYKLEVGFGFNTVSKNRETERKSFKLRIVISFVYKQSTRKP